jgi:NAD(P)-dependent dehydrogenase (short-subunit alcohol dehydrogenase family)
MAKGSDMKFEGKTVVVTGAASGIGRATALRFAAEGANVVAADVDEAGGQSLASESNGQIRFKLCDVSVVGAIKALMDDAAKDLGGLDVVFNNAGAVGAPDRIDEIDEDKWDQVMNVILRSVAMGIRYAAPHMKGRKGASIVNTASVAGHRTGLGTTAYGAAKAGVLHLTRLAAADLARHGIRVNSISPGMINTNIYAQIFKLPADEFAELKPKLAALSATSQPVARPGTSDDVASMVLFLASDEASFITGADMLVDGGITLGERRSWDPETPSPFAGLMAELANKSASPR